MNPLANFLRSRLHRRLFVWFGATILMTGVLVALTMALLSSWWGNDWNAEIARAEAFVSGRFVRVWDHPAEREELAAATAEDLAIGVRLEDPQGRLLSQHGPECTHHKFSVAIKQGAE